MTNKIPVYNIIVSLDKDIFADIKRSAPESFSNFFRPNSKSRYSNSKNAVLFNSIADNFIRMSHTYSFAEKKGKETDNFTIMLEVLDPGRVFDQNFLVNSLTSMLTEHKGIFGANAEKDVNKIKETVTNANQYPDDQFVNSLDLKDVDDTTEKELYDLNKKINELKVQNPPQEQKKEHEAKITAAQAEFRTKKSLYVAELETTLEQLEKGPLTEFYISYGCGSNLENWAGPFLCYLTGAEINLSAESGVRTISLLFTTNAKFPALNPLDYARLNLGKDIQVQGTYDLLTLVNQNQSNQAPQTSTDNNKNSKASQQTADLMGSVPPPKTGSSQGFDVDYHYAISECIKDYISQCVGHQANVVVLFPNLNELITPLKTNLEKHYNFNNTTFGTDSIYWTTPSGKVIPILKKDIFLTAEIFKHLGFVVDEVIVNTQSGEIITHDLDAVLATNGTQAGVEKYIEQLGTAITTGKNLKLRLVKIKGQSYLDPLNKIEEEMPLVLRIIDPVMYVENNIDFLTEFKAFCDMHAEDEKFRRNTLDQDRLNAGLESSNLEEIININLANPLIIYGDRTMIDRYFYGKINIEKSGLFKFTFGQEPPADNEILLQYQNLVAKRDCKYATSQYLDIAYKYFQRAKQDDCFNSYTLPKSQFAYSDDDEKKILESNIPIFKYGVQDSNVLDLDININQFYWNILSHMAYVASNQYKSSTGVYTSIDDVFKPLLQLSKEDVAKIIKSSSLFDNNKLTDKGYEEAKKIDGWKDIPREDMNNLLVSLLAFGENKTQLKTLDWWKSDNPAVHFYNLLVHMSRLAYKGSIKTLPFFHLSNSIGSLNPCLLFAKETSILNLSKNNSITDSLTGLWVIYGYEHLISREDVYSYFHIMKDIRIQYPKGLIPRLKETDAEKYTEKVTTGE